MQQKFKKNDVKVFLDIKINGINAGRLEFELFNADLPETSENFRCLCTGEKGKCKFNSSNLHYKNTFFHRIIPGFLAQGGDIQNTNGKGGESIQGEKFIDEKFIQKHKEFGTLSMANSGPNSNNSQFFISFLPCPKLDNKNIVFGRLTKGENTLREIEKQGTISGEPKAKVEISASGQFIY